VDFKYFKDYQLFASLSEEPGVCEICDRSTICFDNAYYGSEDIEHLCPQCLFEQKLFGKEVFTNSGDSAALKTQLRAKFKDLPESEILARADVLTRELEQATPHLVTWQDMEWPCAEGDYARFIGFGSKPFFNSLAPDGNGKALYERSLHEDLLEFYDDDEWKDKVHDKMIRDLKDSSQYSIAFYVFQSLHSDKLIVWWDCD